MLVTQPNFRENVSKMGLYSPSPKKLYGEFLRVENYVPGFSFVKNGDITLNYTEYIFSIAHHTNRTGGIKYTLYFKWNVFFLLVDVLIYYVHLVIILQNMQIKLVFCCLLFTLNIIHPNKQVLCVLLYMFIYISKYVFLTI